MKVLLEEGYSRTRSPLYVIYYKTLGSGQPGGGMSKLQVDQQSERPCCDVWWIVVLVYHGMEPPDNIVNYISPDES